MERRRRQFLTLMSAGALIAVAGCSDSDPNSDGGASGDDSPESTDDESGNGGEDESGLDADLFGVAGDVDPPDGGELQLVEGSITNVLTGLEVVEHVGVVGVLPEGNDNDDSFTISARIENVGNETVNLFNYGGAKLVLYGPDGNQVDEGRSGVTDQSGEGTPPGETFILNLYGGGSAEDVSGYEIVLNCDNTAENLAYCPEN